jgi:autophagy-related protein 18
MDPYPADDTPEGPIAISFNHDASCVSIGTRSGFYIYNLVPALEQRLRCGGEGMRVVEMLYVTSLLAVVGSGDSANSNPRLMQLWNSQSRVSV